MDLVQAGSWSYSGDPSNSQRDEVRARTGDVFERDKKASDEEVDWALAEESSVILAAARVCEIIQMKVAAFVATSGGGFSKSAQQLFEHYGKCAERLRDLGGGSLAGSTSGPILVGGAIVSENEVYDRDETIRKNDFRINIHDDPRTRYPEVDHPTTRPGVGEEVEEP